MGFFNWIMNGLGFEGDNKKKKKSTEVATEDKYANFNLHERVKGETNTAESFAATSFNNFGIQSESNIILVEPKSHKEIQQVVDYLKQGQTIAVNLEGIAQADSERILDFLSGALYGLDGSIHRWHGDLFILTPNGHKILRPDSEQQG